MKKMIATMVGVGVFASASIFAVMATASPANADTCRESFLGDDFLGNKRFDCPDGTYTLKKPLGGYGWDSPVYEYEFEKDSMWGSGWSGTCRYESFRNSYDCRQDIRDYGYDYASPYSYDDPFSFNDPFSSGW